MAKIRILIIGNDSVLRNGIVSAIDTHRDITVAQSSDGTEDVVKKIHTVKPHVLLIDLGLNSHNSLTMVAALKGEIPDIKVIGMGFDSSRSDILEFVKTGAEGFILKSATVNEAIKTIRSVHGGETVLPPQMAGSLFSQVIEESLGRAKRDVSSAIRMTEREKEIIALITEGMSNKQISTQLDIAAYTVKSHVHNILAKLALNSRLQIANYASDNKSF